MSLTVDIIGDSYAAGDGMSGTYLDPGDQRNRSRVAPALQALSRIAQERPGLVVDANLAASAGAVTADFFGAQKNTDGSAVVNTAQRDQIRPTAQVVIIGFGGNDAELARVLGVAIPSDSTKPGDLDAKIRSVGGLLDVSASDQAYLDQAASSAPGQAPTLVSRMLQVLAGIAQRAPGARIVVTNYPLAIDAQDPNTAALINSRDLVTVQKFIYDLNESIARAVRICECAGLVDLSGALAGHEAYTSDTAFNEQDPDKSQREQVQPSDEGAALMANPLATDLAKLLGIQPPPDSDGTVTEPANIQTRSGVSDRDGDLVPDTQDAAPDDRTRGRNTSDSGRDTSRSDRGRSDRDGSGHHGSQRSDDRRGGSRSGIPGITVHIGLPLPDPDHIPAVPIPLLQGLPPNNKPAIARDDTDPNVDDRDGGGEVQTTLADIGRAQEVQAPPSAVSPLSQAQSAAMEDVIYKAQPAGYVILGAGVACLDVARGRTHLGGHEHAQRADEPVVPERRGRQGCPGRLPGAVQREHQRHPPRDDGGGAGCRDRAVQPDGHGVQRHRTGRAGCLRCPPGRRAGRDRPGHADLAGRPGRTDARWPG
jgi:lysophospholipase L1-like esterase